MDHKTNIAISPTYGNMEFRFFDLGNGQGLTSSNGTRLVLDGKAQVSTYNSAKFGKQVQFQIWGTNEIRTEQASASKYRRVEIYFSYSEIDNLIAALVKIKQMTL